MLLYIDNSLTYNRSIKFKRIGDKVMDVQSIIDLIKSGRQFSNEEQTKQALIMPMFYCLGYSIFDPDEFRPETQSGFATKYIGRVDYQIYLDNKPVMLVECKKFGESIQNHIDQLRSYFNSDLGMKIALLTNGDDYWFFTDSENINIMDREPFFKIKISQAEKSELDDFMGKFSKDKILSLDIKKDLKWQKYLRACDKFINNIKTNSIPYWVIQGILKDAGMDDTGIDRTALSTALYSRAMFTEQKQSLNAEQDEYLVGDTFDEVNNQKSARRAENRSNRSNIQLNHEYIYNENDWTFHKIGYAVILGVKYNKIQSCGLLVEVIKKLLELGYLEREELISNVRLAQGLIVTDLTGLSDSRRRACIALPEYKLYVHVGYNIMTIMRHINCLLAIAHLPDDSVKLSFVD